MFKEKQKEECMNSVSIPKIKGVTKITLRNAETGEVEKELVEENLVTNAVADIFKANYLGSLNYANFLPLATNALGGVLCFANAIEENAENYFLPTSEVNTLTAHAGQQTYEAAGSDQKRGNPNSNLSGVITNGYSMTWDFAATQGNGTISAVCLTHKDTGDFFLYNGSSFLPTQLVNFERAESSPSGEAGALNSRCCFNSSKNTAYGFYINGALMKVRVHKHFNLLKVDVASNYPYSSDYSEFEVTLGHNYDSFAYYLYDEISNVLTLLRPNSNGSDTLLRDAINLTTKNVDSDSFTVAGASFYYGEQGGNSSFAQSLRVLNNGRIYIPKADLSCFYGINYSNPVDTISTISQSGEDFRITHSSNYSYENFSAGNYVHIANCVVEGAKHYKVSEREGSWANHSSFYDDKNLIKPATRRKQSYDNDGDWGLAFSKLYLGTINNLQSPVIKTSAQTMTITYSLIMEN